MGLRFRLPDGTGDVPADVAARRLGLSRQQFMKVLPDLVNRGFPRADPTTGNYDLEAIDAWRRSRNPQLFQLTASLSPLHPTNAVIKERLARMRGG